MSDEPRPFLGLDYAGEDFPSEYRKQELGYETETVFLTDSIKQEPEAKGISARGEDLDGFYDDLLSDFSLVFRYVNEDALQDLMDNYSEDEERDVHMTAPAYTFDEETASLDPNLAWMDRIENVRKPVQMFGIDAIGLNSDGQFHDNTEELEQSLQKAGVYFEPDIQGVARVFYDWSSDEAEIVTYNDTVVARAGTSGEWRSFNYDVDLDEIQNLERALDREISSVNVETFPQTVIPPEINEEV